MSRGERGGLTGTALQRLALQLARRDAATVRGARSRAPWLPAASAARRATEPENRAGPSTGVPLVPAGWEHE